MSPAQKLQKLLHNQMEDSKAKGIYENFMSPNHEKYALKTNRGMLNDSRLKFRGSIANVAQGWQTNTSHLLSNHD